MSDKNNAAAYNHQFAEVNGIKMHYVDENPSSQNVLLLCHGWPDLWLGWREQIFFLSQLGYRVIVPSMRGFGGTESPADPEKYGMGVVCADLVALLDHLQIPTVTVLGHDWGGVVVWRFAQFYPERTHAVASFCTPYLKPETQYVPLEELVKKVPNFSYQLYLTTPEAEQELNENTEAFFIRLLRPIGETTERFLDRETMRLVAGRGPMAKCDSLPASVLDYYVEQFQKTGFRGPQNWYKQSKRNFEQCKDLDPIIRKPSLMVAAELDPALPPAMTAKMPEYVPDLEMHIVKGSGHWLLWEKPEDCNAILKEWLNKVAPASSKI
ncbi:Alpha/Beta hydrolase protein [Radiomyces spectabilis]|uniref:Alpha/Beta hydrolase protein n=1 Tax=Radiomyces spectabilis TaxID=64574 RepID=UPI00222100DF|nr:Alpha/Beta hydrolase protein [Radiomyces spectabilis]KAI8366840.1 Alpha/Beta hydrolase protein [Radiomyces spectabilis]